MRLEAEAGSADRRYRWGAVVLWLIPLAAVSVMVARDPAAHSVTPVFHLAARRWFLREDLYADVRGFHYLPQFALFFAPFHLLPQPLGDIAWRLASAGVWVYGVVAFGDRVRAGNAGRILFFTTLLALGPCLGALRNGQTNLMFGGLTMLLAAQLADERWSRAAACVVLLVLVKPLGAVFVAAMPLVYRRTVVPLAIALTALATLPLLFAPPGWVLSQYRRFAEHMAIWSSTTEPRFADVAGLLRAFGIRIGGDVLRWLRAGAALAVAGLWTAVGSRRDEPARSMTLVLLGGLFLMLFNPMTEKNSYAIVAPALALCAVIGLENGRGIGGGAVLAFVVLSIGVLPELFWRFDRNFGLWWDPLMMLAAAAALAWSGLRREGIFAEPAGAAARGRVVARA